MPKSALKRQGKQRIRFCHVANEQGVEDLRLALNEAGVEYVDEGSSLVEPRWQRIWVWALSASHLLLLKPKARSNWAILPFAAELLMEMRDSAPHTSNYGNASEYRAPDPDKEVNMENVGNIDEERGDKAIVDTLLSGYV